MRKEDIGKREMKYIYIQPIGEVEKGLLDYLVTRLEDVYGYPCRIAPPVRVPESSYSTDREQYNAEVLVGCCPSVALMRLVDS